jgi:hypothetical protein
MPTFSIPSHSKIYPNWDFWFENKPSGNPALEGGAVCEIRGRHVLGPESEFPDANLSKFESRLSEVSYMYMYFN